MNRKNRLSVNGLTKHEGVLSVFPKTTQAVPLNVTIKITRLLLKELILTCCLFSGPSGRCYPWPTAQFTSLMNFLHKKKYEFNQCCIIVGDINFSYTEPQSMTSTHWEEQHCLNQMISANLEQLTITKKRKPLNILIFNKHDTFLVKVGVYTHLEFLLSSNHQRYAANLNLHVKTSDFLNPVDTTPNDWRKLTGNRLLTS